MQEMYHDHSGNAMLFNVINLKVYKLYGIDSIK